MNVALGTNCPARTFPARREYVDDIDHRATPFRGAETALGRHTSLLRGSSYSYREKEIAIALGNRARATAGRPLTLHGNFTRWTLRGPVFTPPHLPPA